MGLLMLFLFFSCNSATYQFLQMSLCYVISPELSVLFLKTTQLCWKLILPVCSLLEIREFSFYQNEGPLVLVKLLFWDQQQMCSLFIFLGTPVWPLILLITTSSIFSFYIYLILLFNMNMPLYFLFFFLLFYVTFRRREVLNLLFFFWNWKDLMPSYAWTGSIYNHWGGKTEAVLLYHMFPLPITAGSGMNNFLKAK